MSIEPHQAITVRTPVIRSCRQDEESTPEDYQNDLRRRFGYLPSMEELAIRESRAMRVSMGLPPGGSLRAFGSASFTDEQRRKLSEACIRKGQERVEQLLTHMTRPKTVETLASDTGWPPMTIRRALNRAKLDGRVRVVQKKAPMVWEVKA